MTHQLIARFSVGLFIGQTLVLCFYFLLMDYTPSVNNPGDLNEQQISAFVDYSIDQDLSNGFQLIEEELEEEYDLSHPESINGALIIALRHNLHLHQKGNSYTQIPYSPPDYC